MPDNTCQYWKCSQSIPARHFLCEDHYGAWQDGDLDRCPRCHRFKDAAYELCLDCRHGRKVAPLATLQVALSEGTASPRLRPRTSKRYTQESSQEWEEGDAEASRFYVYILKLDGGKFYVGQSRDVRARLSEHVDGKVATTAKLHPRLQWFTEVATREQATSLEVEMKKLVDSNPRKVRTMIIRFQDLVEELKFE